MPRRDAHQRLVGRALRLRRAFVPPPRFCSGRAQWNRSGAVRRPVGSIRAGRKIPAADQNPFKSAAGCS